MNTTDLGCTDCGEPWPIYTANCKGCEARAMLCFAKSEASFHEDMARKVSPVDGGALCVGIPAMLGGLALCLCGSWIVVSGVWSVCGQLAALGRFVLAWAGL